MTGSELLERYWGQGRLTSIPPRVIQGIVTGIGFLGAGMIMKDGMSISGLTSAASLWASSAIGVLIGVDLYLAAILLTLFTVRFDAGKHCWRFVAIEVDRSNALPLTRLSNDLARLGGIEAFEIGHARN